MQTLNLLSIKHLRARGPRKSLTLNHLRFRLWQKESAPHHKARSHPLHYNSANYKVFNIREFETLDRACRVIVRKSLKIKGLLVFYKCAVGVGFTP